MDKIDMQILSLLETKGRITHEEIGKQLNISRPAIHKRIAKLEHKEVIKGYHAIIDWSKTGQDIKAIIFIKINTSDFNKVMEEVVNLNISELNIEKCYRITGQWCLMLQIRVNSTKQITLLHDELLKIEGIRETLTMLILYETNKQI